MNEPSNWESILSVILSIALVIWMYPRLKYMNERSKQATPNWQAALIPIGVVLLFVIFLILATRKWPQ